MVATMLIRLAPMTPRHETPRLWFAQILRPALDLRRFVFPWPRWPRPRLPASHRARSKSGCTQRRSWFVRLRKRNRATVPDSCRCAADSAVETTTSVLMPICSHSRDFDCEAIPRETGLGQTGHGYPDELVTHPCGAGKEPTNDAGQMPVETPDYDASFAHSDGPQLNHLSPLGGKRISMVATTI